MVRISEFHMLVSISTALFLATQTIQPMFPLYVVQKGASTLELGAIVSIMSLTAMVAKVPLSILLERIGKWSAIPVALLGESFSLLLYSIASSPLWFYPIRVLHAITVSAFAPTAISIASDLALAGRRGDRIGKFLTSFGAATMLGPFLCSLLLEYLNYVQILRTVAVIPLLGLAALFLARRRASYLSWNSEERVQPITFGSLRGILASGNVLALSFLRLAFSFSDAIFTTMFAIYASENLLMASSAIAFLIGIRGVTNMVFRFPSGRLSDRIGHRIPLVLSYSMLAVTYLVISESADFIILSIAMTVYGLAHAMRAVTEWTLMGESTNPDTSTMATAYLSTMFNIGGAAGAITSGLLSLALPIHSIFKIASLVVLPGALVPFLTKTNRPMKNSARSQ